MVVDAAAVLASFGLSTATTSVASFAPDADAGQPGRRVTPGVPAVGSDDGDHGSWYAASVTKQVLAVLAARAVLAGRLAPDSPVSTHLPQLPAWMAPVQVQHLVHHTAALPTTGDLAAAAGVPESELDNALVLRTLAGWPAPAGRGTTFTPGSRFAYSNTGYVVLAEVVRAVCGSELPVLAERDLFVPLGMHRTRLGGPPAPAPVGSRHPPRTVGDGGLWTSAADLLLWLRALNEQRFGAELESLVLTPGRLRDRTPLEHAWGVRVRAGAGGRWVTHGGDWPGWAAKTVRVPEQQVAVAVVHRGPSVQGVSDAAEAIAHAMITA